MKFATRIKDSLYTIADRLSGGRGWERVVSGQRLRLPLRYCRWFAQDYEAANVAFVNSVVEPGMTVMDVGAHIGFYSVLLARRVGSGGRVFAFEPTPSSFEVLGHTLRLNQVESIVSIQEMAVGATCSEVDFYVTDLPAHNSNRLNPTRRENERAIRVAMTSVDEWVLARKLAGVDFLKIDAEGSELAVLKGLSRVLEKHRPCLLLALHPHGLATAGDSLEEIWDFLSERAYRVHQDGQPMSRPDFIRRATLFDVQLHPTARS